MSTDTTARPAPLDGLRKPQRERLMWALRQLLAAGHLNRRDIMTYGEVSEPQASVDLREIMARLPGVMAYDRNSKSYRPTAEAPTILEPILAVGGSPA